MKIETIEVTMTRAEVDEAFEYSIPGLLSVLEENAAGVADYCRRQLTEFVLGRGERGQRVQAVRILRLPNGKPPSRGCYNLRQSLGPPYWKVSFEIAEEDCDE